LKPSHKATRRRAQGRPNEGRNSVGPEVLLQATRKLLEELPPAKVTRAAVARRAGVDPNLIRYYFQDRDSLILAVVEQILAEFSEANTDESSGSAVEQLRAHIRNFIQFNTQYPFFQRLILEEIANWKSVRAKQLVQRLNQSSIAILSGILKDGGKDRSLRQLDPVLMHIALIGVSEFFKHARVLLDDGLGKPGVPADLTKRYTDLVAQLVLDGARQR
jgi:TetR/AcrR family transcriptional regulator